MSTLSEIKNRIAKLERASDPKGTPDNFTNLSAAVAAGSSNEHSEEETFAAYSFSELQWSFGRNTSQWPLWARQKFGVV